MLKTRKYMLDADIDITTLILKLDQKMRDTFNLVSSSGLRGGDNTYTMETPTEETHFDTRDEFIKYAQSLCSPINVTFRGSLVKKKRFMQKHDGSIFSIWFEGYKRDIKFFDGYDHKDEGKAWSLEVKVGSTTKPDILDPMFEVIESVLAGHTFIKPDPVLAIAPPVPAVGQAVPS